MNCCHLRHALKKMTQIIRDDMRGRIQKIQKYIMCEPRYLFISPRTFPSLQMTAIVIFVIKYRHLHIHKYIVLIFFFFSIAMESRCIFFFYFHKNGIFSMPSLKAILANKDFECGPFK